MCFGNGTANSLDVKPNPRAFLRVFERDSNSWNCRDYVLVKSRKFNLCSLGSTTCWTARWLAFGLHRIAERPESEEESSDWKRYLIWAEKKKRSHQEKFREFPLCLLIMNPAHFLFFCLCCDSSRFHLLPLSCCRKHDPSPSAVTAPPSALWQRAALPPSARTPTLLQWSAASPRSGALTSPQACVADDWVTTYTQEMCHLPKVLLWCLCGCCWLGSWTPEQRRRLC